MLPCKYILKIHSIIINNLTLEEKTSFIGLDYISGQNFVYSCKLSNIKYVRNFKSTLFKLVE
jgi:hypothetical protein